MKRKSDWFVRLAILLANLGVASVTGALAGPVGTFGVYTNAQGGGQCCGADATYSTAAGGNLGSSVSPGNTSISGCTTPILTGTATPGLTSAFSQILAAAFDSNNNPISSSAYAAASLATGQMHLSEADGGEGNGYAEVMMWDTLTFNIPGATDSTVTPVDFSFALDGLSAGATNNLAIVSFDVGNSVPCLCTSDTDVWGFNAGNSGLATPFGDDLNNNSFVTWTVTNNNDTAAPAVTISGAVNLTGVNPTLGFAFDVQLSSNVPGGSLDFSNTGTFSVTAPEGDTFTSDSTVFLTQSGAPEPSSSLLIGFGLAGVGLIRRLARRRVHRA